MIAVDERLVYALNTRPAVPASYAEALERARALKPRLRERVPETESLRRLPAENVADLLEKRHLPVDCEAALSDTSQPTKGHYVSRQKLPLSPNPVAPSQEDALGPVARDHTHSVSSTPDPISAKGRAQLLDGKERS